MKEFIKTISSELIRLKNEGCDYVNLDEESLSILKKLAPKNSEPEFFEEKIEKTETPKIIKNTFAEGVNFVKSLDIPKEEFVSMPKKINVVKSTSDFSIAPIPAPKKFTLPEGDKKTKWEFLRNLVLNDSVCKEHVKAGKNLVFGVGSLDADIFFCGEAPGADEEIQCEPFVGKAGQLLTKIITAMGLSREQVYIGNIMNWRPELPTSSGNRPPTDEEMDYCLPYLKAQVDIVNPKVIVALGGTATSGLLGKDPKRTLGSVRGKWTKYGDYDLIVTYHPSYLLQYATPAAKRKVWEDMMAVMEKVSLPISEKQKAYFL